jgi:putative endonuclease
MWIWRRTTKPKPLGQQGEDLAVRHLRRKGYRILDRNVVLGKYEIDIIAATRDTTIFVEVRTRETADPVRPEDSIGPKKRDHIRKAAKRYIARENNPDRYYRYDIVAIVFPSGGKPQIEHFENAFGERER